jgi:hypothetical protein
LVNSRWQIGTFAQVQGKGKIHRSRLQTEDRMAWKKRRGGKEAENQKTATHPVGHLKNSRSVGKSAECNDFAFHTSFIQEQVTEELSRETEFLHTLACSHLQSHKAMTSYGFSPNSWRARTNTARLPILRRLSHIRRRLRRHSARSGSRIAAEPTISSVAAPCHLLPKPRGSPTGAAPPASRRRGGVVVGGGGGAGGGGPFSGGLAALGGLGGKEQLGGNGGREQKAEVEGISRRS